MVMSKFFLSLRHRATKKVRCPNCDYYTIQYLQKGKCSRRGYKRKDR